MDPIAADPPPTSDQDSSPVWGPVATILWTVVIAIVFVVVQAFTGLVYAIVTMRHLSRSQVDAAVAGLTFDGTFLSLCTFATLVVCVPLILGITKLKRGSKLRDYLGLKVPRLRQLLQWSLITSAFCGLAALISSLVGQPMPEFMLKAYASANPRWALWAALAIAAPVFEEIFFRGFLFKGLAASRLHWQGATVITSILWAAIHVQYGWYEIVTIFALGLLLGAARAITHSTLLTMWLHCFVNVLATAEVAVMLRQSPVNN